jgi:hypothetical protein
MFLRIRVHLILLHHELFESIFHEGIKEMSGDGDARFVQMGIYMGKHNDTSNWKPKYTHTHTHTHTDTHTTHRLIAKIAQVAALEILNGRSWCQFQHWAN